MNNDNDIELRKSRLRLKDMSVVSKGATLLWLCHDDDRLFCEIMDVLENHLKRLKGERTSEETKETSANIGKAISEMIGDR